LSVLTSARAQGRLLHHVRPHPTRDASHEDHWARRVGRRPTGATAGSPPGRGAHTAAVSTARELSGQTDGISLSAEHVLACDQAGAQAPARLSSAISGIASVGDDDECHRGDRRRWQNPMMTGGHPAVRNRALGGLVAQGLQPPVRSRHPVQTRGCQPGGAWSS